MLKPSTLPLQSHQIPPLSSKFSSFSTFPSQLRRKKENKFFFSGSSSREHKKFIKNQSTASNLPLAQFCSLFIFAAFISIKNWLDFLRIKRNFAYFWQFCSSHSSISHIDTEMIHSCGGFSFLSHSIAVLVSTHDYNSALKFLQRENPQRAHKKISTSCEVVLLFALTV